MFKKFRDQVDAATKQATARGEQEFHQHAARFRQEAARQGYDIRPQLPTEAMAAQAFGADPDLAAFLALPAEEQLRLQAVANAYGQELRRLHETGHPATAVIRTLDPTGVAVAGLRQYTSLLDVTRADGATYQTTVAHMVPTMTYSQYAPGTRHEVRIDPANPAVVGVFGLVG
ncbi:hypothetical protein [Actinosynnema sp. NPDC020468]|uniref:hypothetical protein n=1 Tax=Actinosynnema sp. NPDC020468 TaxID=3154488 RepID=UPI0033E723F4